jgi:hypothetical protein
MNGLKNLDLEKMGKKLLGKYFLGVFSSDIYPKNFVKKKKFFIIFNLSKHFQAGSHFIAIAKNKNKIIYFDPLGHKCMNIGILKFLLKNKIKVLFNHTKIQSDYSVFCGYFCLAFLLHMLNTNSLKSFVTFFSLSNLKKNDNLCIEYILNKIK